MSKPRQAGPVKYRARRAMTPPALAGVGVTSPTACTDSRGVR